MTHSRHTPEEDPRAVPPSDARPPSRRAGGRGWPVPGSYLDELLNGDVREVFGPEPAPGETVVYNVTGSPLGVTQLSVTLNGGGDIEKLVVAMAWDPGAAPSEMFKRLGGPVFDVSPHAITEDRRPIGRTWLFERPAPGLESVGFVVVPLADSTTLGELAVVVEVDRWAVPGPRAERVRWYRNPHDIAKGRFVEIASNHPQMRRLRLR